MPQPSVRRAAARPAAAAVASASKASRRSPASERDNFRDASKASEREASPS